ncbi:MAG: rod shape-determining protein RodA [Clostridium baratii]|uniref:Rod shape-determining protein RodA n=1 Tax=Clostridium baratii str. Sullivan TaxID=1415775 RepID=A0A0A7FUF4_9CLOT|nr:rod shape-determining protein RodA [Clostridium baratii]AIY83232.1 rod shape-determining protein RodA [Clostridium baratii str. Sullivan]MBS6005465.1 rod shape-determining protein RodA [Clostridium baratii]MDU1052532.1 rod shape-determining protein RodA [Clostridium baratii]MDU4910022.1 rod shape-determining protein RodA [Clostridium baratii]CUP34632.1 cell cycle protein [Clostridium baratii]
MLRGDLLFDRQSTYNKYKLDFKKIRDIDKVLLISTILLVLFGILNIYLAKKGENFATKQFVWFIVSLVALYIFMAIDYRVLYNYVPIFYWGGVGLLILTRFVGSVRGGAKGWITFGPVSLQPAELAKIGMILMLAKKLEEMDLEINNLKNFFTLVFYAAVPVAFIIVQPDMGMTMVSFFIVLGIFYVAGLDGRVIGGGLLALFLSIIIVWNSGLIQDYQKGRITSFMNPEANMSGSGYHLSQSLIAIGSGGVLGNAPSLANDASTGYAAQHVPEVQTDFIFAAIAEHFGLIGVLFLLLLYGLLISRMITIARTSKDIFGSIICVGLVSYFLFALLQNIGMTIGLVPITGITLPLISYGGSSLLTTIMSIGLVLNVGMRRKKIRF